MGTMGTVSTEGGAAMQTGLLGRRKQTSLFASYPGQSAENTFGECPHQIGLLGAENKQAFFAVLRYQPLGSTANRLWLGRRYGNYGNCGNCGNCGELGAAM